MKSTKLISIIIFLLVQLLSVLVIGKLFASDKLVAESYYRICMGIQTDKPEAKEVVNQLQNALMKEGIVISKSKKDPLVEGSIVVETHGKNKVNPYDIGEFTLHDVVMTLKDLSVKDPFGITLASYQSFSGFGSHEIESRAVADATEQIINQLKETDFLLQAAKVARRQDIVIKTNGKAGREQIQEEITDALGDYMNPVLEELQLTRNKLKEALDALAEKKRKQVTSVDKTVRIGGSELNRIIDGSSGELIKASYKYYEVIEEDKTKHLYKDVTGVIIDAHTIRDLPLLRLQRVYSEGGLLIFGGKRNRNFNPLLHFSSKQDILLSDFKTEAKTPITVQAIGLTDRGHIIVSDRDAEKIFLADKGGRGKIFEEGRIFVLTGKRY